ncbi:hypothetical protein [Gordonia sp. NB41Y]|uniref:hypothetical protein n=1 Tax=Gordonia sp. NB41Y TaxID=875808 RepID=UPI0002BF2D0F|nr:hypothetical protein [Gordonia sp. NB41Y]EMP12987.1 hypothetical protein ISGA_3490 [Gordonia sp. NB41Y]WLP92535.1 hypothetical protein Q9K23_10055 [Gordonia sp. NB41Y]
MHVARNPRRQTGLMMGLVAAGVTAAVAAPFASGAAPVVAADAVTTAALTTTAEPSPIVYYQQVIAETLANLQDIGTTIGTQGATPILTAILNNQAEHAQAVGAALGEIGPNLIASLQTDLPRYLTAAQTEFEAGNIDAALNQLFVAVLVPVLKGLDLFGGTLTPIIAALSEPLENLNAVVKWQLANSILIGGIALISPIAGAYGGLGDGIQDMVTAVENGDAVSVMNALLNFPGKVVGGFLNGGSGPNLGSLLGIDIPGIVITSGGLLGGAGGGANGTSLFGSIPALQSLQQSIAGILDGTSSLSPHPNTDTRSITVTLGATSTDAATTVSTPASTPETVEVSAPEAATPETTTPESSAPETGAAETPAPETTTPETIAPEATAPETTGSDSADSGAPADPGTSAADSASDDDAGSSPGSTDGGSSGDDGSSDGGASTSD